MTSKDKVVRCVGAASYVFAACLLLRLGAALAQNTDASVPGLKPPQATLKIVPSMPSDPLTDGFAIFRYTINAAGHVADIERLGGYHDDDFGTPTREAMLEWRFNPATANGAPVPWYDQYQNYLFILQRPQKLFAEPGYKSATAQIDALLAAHDYDGAKAEAKKQAANAYRLPEYITFEIQLAHAEIGLGRQAAAANALETVMMAPLKEYASGLRELFALDADLGQFEGARSAFIAMETLQAGLIRQGDRGDPVYGATETARAQKIWQAWLSGEPLKVTGSIASDNWRHTPTGRTFTIDSVDGPLTALTARCHLLPPTALVAQIGVKLVLPANGGWCELEFTGAADTEIHLTEYPERPQ